MDAKIADLQVIASTLRGATHAGCDDLSTCEGGPSCPTPFVTIGQAGSTEISLPVPPVTAVQAGYGIGTVPA